MSWLKTWDRCVFKKVESNKRKRQNKVQSQWNANGPANSFDEAAEADPYGRPHEKVLLLAGKPGLGKTTMAEVLATQAGYQVIEINASDDRSSRTVTDQIKSALESRTLDAGAKFGGGLSLKSNRPTCVIIDEIDGAAAGGGGGGGGGNEAGFVKALVKLVTEGSSNAPKFNS
jgi:chromosome transmission fidelity protein 18